MKTFIESNLPMNINQRFSDNSFLWSDQLSEATIQALLVAFAKFLSNKKNKDKIIAIVLTDFTDSFHFGAYVQYVKEENEDGGSWQLNYTFNENDIDPKTMEIHNFSEAECRMMFEDIGYRKIGIMWSYMSEDSSNKPSEACSQSTMVMIFDCIKEYMRANVNYDNKLNIVDYMVFTAELDGDIYISCEPSAILKQYIKEDQNYNTVTEEEE